MPVRRSLKRRGVTVVVCAACQPGTSAESLGVLQAKIFCGKWQGLVAFSTSHCIMYGISVQELLALKNKYWSMLYTE